MKREALRTFFISIGALVFHVAIISEANFFCVSLKLTPSGPEEGSGLGLDIRLGRFGLPPVAACRERRIQVYCCNDWYSLLSE